MKIAQVCVVNGITTDDVSKLEKRVLYREIDSKRELLECPDWAEIIDSSKLNSPGFNDIRDKVRMVYVPCEYPDELRCLRDIRLDYQIPEIEYPSVQIVSIDSDAIAFKFRNDIAAVLYGDRPRRRAVTVSGNAMKKYIAVRYIKVPVVRRREVIRRFVDDDLSEAIMESLGKRIEYGGFYKLTPEALEIVQNRFGCKMPGAHDFYYREIEIKPGVYARCPKCGKTMKLSALPQYAFQCEDCDEDFMFFEANFLSNEQKQETLIAMWELLDDAPYDPDNECFETNVYGIGDEDAPVDKDDVWHWFDDHFDGGLARLMGLA